MISRFGSITSPAARARCCPSCERRYAFLARIEAERRERVRLEDWAARMDRLRAQYQADCRTGREGPMAVDRHRVGFIESFFVRARGRCAEPRHATMPPHSATH